MVAEHSTELGHKINFKDTKVLAKTVGYGKRNMTTQITSVRKKGLIEAKHGTPPSTYYKPVILTNLILDGVARQKKKNSRQSLVDRGPFSRLSSRVQNWKPER
jgi:hypothetical protein